MQSKPKVLVAGLLLPEAIKSLREAADVKVLDGKASTAELVAGLQDCEALVSVVAPQISKEVLAQAQALKLVANVAVGYDNIDLESATALGIVVTNTPGVLDDSVADFAFGLAIASARRIVEADRYVREKRFRGWDIDLFLGSDVFGKTLGIIGYGRIGHALAKRAQGFSMKILYSKRNQKTEADTTYGATGVSLDYLLRESDFISIHCPLNESTHHLIGKRELALVKPSCILVNTARGAIIDELALIDALKSGKLKSAALDVFEYEPEISEALLGMDNVVLAPHIGSASMETRVAMCNLAVEGLRQAFSGNRPKNIVNPKSWDSFCRALSLKA